MTIVLSEPCLSGPLSEHDLDARIADKLAPLSSTPAWPMFPVVLPAPVKFDSLHCSADNHVRVATVGGSHFVSIDGDNFCGPFKTQERVREFLGRVHVERQHRRFES